MLYISLSSYIVRGLYSPDSFIHAPEVPVASPNCGAGARPMRADAFPSPAPRPAGSRACAHDAWKVRVRVGATPSFSSRLVAPPHEAERFSTSMLLGPRTQPSRDRHDARTIAVCRTTQPYLADQFRLVALSKHGDEPHLTLQICALPNREPPSSVFLALPPRLLPSDLLGSQGSTGYGKCEGCPVVLTPANNCTAQSYSINGEDAAWKRNYRIQTRKRARESTKEPGRPRTGEKGEGKGFLHSYSALTRVAPHPVAADPGHPTLALDPLCILHPTPFPPPRTCNVSKSSRPTMASFMMSAE